MDTFIKADIFFVISSVGFIIVALCGSLLLIALAMVAFRVRRMIARLETKAGEIGDDVKDLVYDIRESALLRMFIRRRKK
jgi:hypothetical protein